MIQGKGKSGVIRRLCYFICTLIYTIGIVLIVQRVGGKFMLFTDMVITDYRIMVVIVTDEVTEAGVYTD